MLSLLPLLEYYKIKAMSTSFFQFLWITFNEPLSNRHKKGMEEEAIALQYHLTYLTPFSFKRYSPCWKFDLDYT